MKKTLQQIHYAHSTLWILLRDVPFGKETPNWIVKTIIIVKTETTSKKFFVHTQDQDSDTSEIEKKLKQKAEQQPGLKHIHVLTVIYIKCFAS